MLIAMQDGACAVKVARIVLVQNSMAMRTAIAMLPNARYLLRERI